MAAVGSENLTLRLLAKDDKVRKAASHGDPAYLPLRVFLENDAKDHHASHISKTYVFATAQNKVFAYITLTCSQIQLDEKTVPDDAKKVDFPFPCIKIAKLMVDKNLRQAGLGKKLVDLAITIALDKVMPHVGCRFVTVDSHHTAMNFYRKCGFTPLNTPDNLQAQNPLMFLDLSKL